MSKTIDDETFKVIKSVLDVMDAFVDAAQITFSEYPPDLFRDLSVAHMAAIIKKPQKHLEKYDDTKDSPVGASPYLN